MKYTPEHAAIALGIMERLLPQVDFRDEYGELIAILREPKRWKEAHAHFKKIRANITLPSEAHRRKMLDACFIYVAENAAKTAYNCSGETAPFDDESYERLLWFEREFLEQAACMDTNVTHAEYARRVIYNHTSGIIVLPRYGIK